jgi:hypothetical protein
VNARRDRELPIAIIGSLLVHVLLFALVAWLFSASTQMALERFQQAPPPPPPPEPVTLLFPDQIIIPPAPPPPQKKEIYIRTTQSAPSADKPKSPAFISDRNTKASAKLAPDPAGTEPLPTTKGIAITMGELANRDYRDGDIKEDSAPKTPKQVAAMNPPATPPAQPTPPAPPPQLTPPPQTVAKAKTETTPLAQMMKEADKDLARVDMNRLPLEVRKPDPVTPQMKEPDTPPPTAEAMPKPQMREAPPSAIPKAIPVNDEVAMNTPKPEDKAFMPFTRTSENKGTISNRGTEDAVDAEGSPKGRYIRSVTSQVEKKWHLYRVLKRDAVTFGSLKVVFYVNRKGKVEDLRIINDRESNPLLSEFTVRAIRDAEIPPMPKDVIDILPVLDKQRLKIEYNVLIY